MQRKTKLIAAGAVGLLGLGALATFANADMGNMMGRMMGHGMGGPMMGMMERYDANKDGKITQDEIDKNRAEWLAEFDADKNGTLSLDEFQNLWLKARHEEMVREFQFFDRDGNAQVTLDEYKGPLADLVKERDRNGDGALSRDDRPQRGEGMRGKHGGHGDGMGMHQKGGMGMGMGQGQGMGQGMGPGMMEDDSDDGDEGTPPAPPPAPANP